MQGYPPSARKHHAAEVVGNQMYVFGGVDSDGTLCPPDMHILDLGTPFPPHRPSALPPS